MKTVHAPKADNNTLTIVVDPTKVSRGHFAHRSGAGKHQDKRTKRGRTRGAAFRRALAS
jgi:hypothetical protein